jgi:nitrogen fixation protein FixH
MKAFTTGPFTGRHFSAIIVAFFAVVVGINFMMAYLASSTFGGVVVENSYVAGQHFNRWLDQAEQEKALGWKAEVSRLGDNRIAIVLIGAPTSGVTLGAVARHPLGRMADRKLRFVPAGAGRFVSEQPLPVGRWRLRIEADSATGAWRKEQDIS